MKKFFLSLSLLSPSLLPAAQIAESVWLLTDRQATHIWEASGPMEPEALAPCSTFKMPLAIMGFEEKILINESTPKWPYLKNSYEKDIKAAIGDFFLPVWDDPQTPMTWMKNSTVWFSQKITRKMGKGKFQSYIDAWGYGNKDLSGNPGKDGLTASWLSSSLKITPKAQAQFLARFLTQSLPLVSQETYEKTKKILWLEDWTAQDKTLWSFYGKTGSGHPPKEDGTKNFDVGLNWFIGWMEPKGAPEKTKIIVTRRLGSPELSSRELREETIKKLKQSL